MNNTDPLAAIIRVAQDYTEYCIREMHKTEECDSPIETLFRTALFTWVKYGASAFSDVVFIRNSTENYFVFENTTSLLVQCQAPIDQYRVDFLIFGYDYLRSDWDDNAGKLVHDPKLWRPLVVECDGHDFHEHTKEQAARDRARDRHLFLKKYPVFRFTGSELWRDPIGCAKQAVSYFER